MNTEQVLFALLRSVICGEKISESVIAACTPERLEGVYTLAAKHDLAHLVGQAVSKLPLPESETLTKCKKAAMQAFARYMLLDQAYQQICQTLEKAEIPFIPLKGSVLRAYYPEPWMRTSCDIDVLVHPEDLDAAVRVLTQELEYKYDRKDSHDVSLFTPRGVHIELHYDLIDCNPNTDPVLCHTWTTSAVKEGTRYYRCMTDEMFYFYHIAHMAKHFENGGCGIRPFLDLWILERKVDRDRQKRETLLAEGKLLTFARAAETLVQVWFSSAKWDELSRQVNDYILQAGVYGNVRNQIAVYQAKQGGKLAYAMRRIFRPYDRMKHYYPILQKHKWLLPAYQVVRWFRVLFSGGAGNAVKELQTNAEISSERVASTSKLLRRLGL